MTDFIIHGSQDNVGVLVRDARRGENLAGWNMETDETFRITAGDDIPLGHKIALRPISCGEYVIKYNQPIGKATADILPGGHVHVHNLRSARW